MPETREPLPPFTGDLAELIAYARTLLEHRLVPLKQEAFRDLVAVAEAHQRSVGLVTLVQAWQDAYSDLPPGNEPDEGQFDRHLKLFNDLLVWAPTAVEAPARPVSTLDPLLMDAEIRPLRDDGGGDRIAFLKEQL